MSIEGIALENFSELQHPSPLLSSGDLTNYAVFQSFLYDDSKKYAATASAQSKQLIEIFQNRKLPFGDLSTLW